jgi:transcriptional regulator with XRE-family HTH domain
MGRGSRRRPARLAEKLLEIRTALNLSQNGMVRRLGMSDELSQEYISGFERGTRVPPLLVLLQYARAAGLSMESLVDDKMDLPSNLPVIPKGRRKRD